MKFILTAAALVLAAAASHAQTYEALDEVNAIRSASGLTPYTRDAGLTEAASRAAAYRASYLIAGHTASDFAFLPAGATAPAAGCAAWAPSGGFGACAMFDDYTHAGAAYAMGADGRAYMHLFVRGGSGRTLGQRTPIVPRPLIAHLRDDGVRIPAKKPPVTIPAPLAAPTCPVGGCPAPATFHAERHTVFHGEGLMFPRVRMAFAMRPRLFR